MASDKRASLAWQWQAASVHLSHGNVLRQACVFRMAMCYNKRAFLLWQAKSDKRAPKHGCLDAVDELANLNGADHSGLRLHDFCHDADFVDAIDNLFFCRPGRRAHELHLGRHA